MHNKETMNDEYREGYKRKRVRMRNRKTRRKKFVSEQL